jgi:hypothetical protein
MLPEHEAAAWLQQLPHFPHHTLHIPHRTHYLHAENSIHTPFRDTFSSQNFAIFDTTCKKLVFILEIEAYDFRGDVISILGVGVNGVYILYKRVIVALDLVSCPGAEFKNLAVG